MATVTTQVPTVEQALQFAVEAIERREFQRARNALRWALEQDPQNIVAWLWLARCSPDSVTRQICLQRVAALNPYR